jgi:hypothetical protein
MESGSAREVKAVLPDCVDSSIRPYVVAYLKMVNGVSAVLKNGLGVSAVLKNGQFPSNFCPWGGRNRRTRSIIDGFLSFLAYTPVSFREI